MSQKESFVDDESKTFLLVNRVTEPSGIENCRSGGRTGDLDKPFSWRRLLEVVDAYLASHSVNR